MTALERNLNNKLR